MIWRIDYEDNLIIAKFQLLQVVLLVGFSFRLPAFRNLLAEGAEMFAIKSFFDGRR